MDWNPKINSLPFGISKEQAEHPKTERELFVLWNLKSVMG